MPSPRLEPRTYLRLAQVTLGICVVNVISGAAVRLSDSGLGCSNWPDCTRTELTPPLSLHPMIEFSNRLVVVVLVIAAAVMLAGAFVRAPRRQDLVCLSVALLGGVLAEAVVGGIVVYSKLNPYVVMVHFMVGIALTTVSLVLALRAGRQAPSGTAVRPRGSAATRPLSTSRAVPKVDRPTVWMGRGVLALLALAVAAGTATTGAGPHAGGKGAKRIPVPLADMARTHSGIVLVAVGFVLLFLVVLHRRLAPESTQSRARLLLVVMGAQALVGYTQYFSREPALLVGVHVAGATAVWLTAVWCYDGLFRHPAEEVALQVVAAPEPAVGASA